MILRNTNRLKHSLAVARKMVEIGKSKGLAEEELKDLFMLGYNHDIGYEFGTNENHNVIGANILKQNNYKQSFLRFSEERRQICLKSQKN